MATTVKKQLIVFDFDWSMVDQDTDRWLFEVLAPDIRRRMEDDKHTVQWTDLVARSLRELHARGGTPKQIEETMYAIPFHPAMIRAVTQLKAAKQPQSKFLCLSNSNSMFISTVLKSRDLETLFSDIITNPAEFKENGLLDLKRRVDPNGPQHSCQVGCSPNMCKGEELDAYLDKDGRPYDRVVYVGDGSNDFCPGLRLRSQDLLVCRKYFGLHRRIEKEGAIKGLKCEVKYWEGAWEVEEIFATLREA